MAMIMNIRKYISLITAVFLICTSVSFTSFAFDADDSDDFYEASAVIKNLSGEYFESGDVTRAQFTKALVNVMRIAQGADLTDKSAFPFKDVSENDGYYGEIYRAYKAGIIASGENFNPNENITFAQAVKMCICAVGYADAAEYKGGYPAGYLKCASELKLIGRQNGETFSDRDAVVLLYNLLCSSFMLTEYKNGFAHFEDTDETYLERLYSGLCAEGIVTATNISPSDGADAEEDGYITVDGKMYNYDGGTSGLLGKNVRVFYKKGTSDALFTVERENAVLEFDADGITEFSLGKITVETENSSKEKSYKTVGARYVYNGRTVGTFSLDDINGDYARVLLLDNDDDNNYEYVFVYDYKYLTVDSVQKNPVVISDINNGEKNIFRAKDNDSVLEIYGADGEREEIDDLEKGGIIAAAQSKDLSFALIKKVSGTLDGTLEAKDADGKIYINGEKYTLTDYAKRNYSDIMKLNENYLFALGLNNDIVALNGFSSQMQYGYLTEVTEPENKADDEVKFEVYTLGGVFKTLSVKRAKADGVSNRKKADILPVLNANVSKLIKFKIGRDGTVSVIDTAETVYEYKEPSDDENSLMQYKFTSGGKEVTEFTYRSGGQSCMPYFNVSSSVILRVPEDEDEKDFAILDRTSLNSGYKYKFDVYDLSENGTAGVLVAQDKTVKSRTNYMIEKIRNGAMPNGDDGKVLYVYSSGSYKKLYMSVDAEKQLEKALNPGDIVQATLDADSTVKFIDLVFDAKTLSPSTKTVSGINYDGLNNISYWYGALYYTDGIYGYISKTKTANSYDYSFENLINIRLNTANIGVINKERDEIRPITPSQLKDYKSFGSGNYFIVARLNAQAPMEVYAYEIQ